MFIKIILLCLCSSSVFCGNNHCKRYLTNNAILENFISLYDNLAHTTFDAYNTQRRCFTIMICGILQLMSQDGEGTFEVGVLEPADVIASQYRSLYDLVRVTLDPAINLVQSSCGSMVSSEECDKRISKGIAKLTEECDGFGDHWRFYEVTANIVDDDDYINVKRQVFNATLYCSNDDDAFAFLKRWQYSPEFAPARPKMINWYKTFITGSYPCYLPPLRGYCSPDLKF